MALTFGHSSAGFLIALLILPKEAINLTFLIPISLLSILPDIDLILNIKHRTLTHSIYSILPFILIGILIFLILEYITSIYISVETLIVFLILLWTQHIILDMLFGKVRLIDKQIGIGKEIWEKYNICISRYDMIIGFLLLGIALLL